MTLFGKFEKRFFTYVFTSSVVTALSPLMSYICKENIFSRKIQLYRCPELLRYPDKKAERVVPKSLHGGFSTFFMEF